MNTVEVDSDNSSKDGNDQDNQIEEDNENERDTLQVVEFDSHSSERPQSKKCCKIILVIFISLIFLGVIFFIASKEVKTLYENSISNNNQNNSNNLNAQNNEQINKIKNNEKEINNNITTNNPDLNDKVNEVKKRKENNIYPLENNINVIHSNKITSKVNNINNTNDFSGNKTSEIIDIIKLKPIEDEEQKIDIHFNFNETNKINRKNILNQSEMNQNKIENRIISTSVIKNFDNNFLNKSNENISSIDINNNINTKYSTSVSTNNIKYTKSILQNPISNTNILIHNYSNENFTVKPLDDEKGEKLNNNLSVFINQTKLISSQNIDNTNNNISGIIETTNPNESQIGSIKSSEIIGNIGTNPNEENITYLKFNNSFNMSYLNSAYNTDNKSNNSNLLEQNEIINKTYLNNSSNKVEEKENNETNIYFPKDTYIYNASNELNQTNINKDIEQSIINNLTYSDHKVYGSDKIINENIENNSVINFTEKIKDNLTDSNDTTINGTKKIGIAFVYSTLFSNGIARFITVTANHFMKTGKYDIVFITGKPNRKEYSYDKRIKRYVGEDNFTIIKNITKHENIDFFILQNFLGANTINFYKSLGKKVIGMFHGVYMSAMFHNEPLDYRNWLNFDLFDSFIFIAADDYYFYKNLGFKNEIYIPNLYTFDPKEIKESNLTSHNILMLGRLNDEIKGLKYAVKALYYIVKEVPDAKLTLVTSDYRIEFAKNLSRELNISDSLVINYHTYNISQHFWNSAVHMYTSLTEAFPMAMNEAKAHGLPIVAFDVPFSPPYQDGVITVDLLDCKGLARETIKLLKDYNYRKKMGEAAKLSLNKFSSEEIVEMWGKLFKSLLSEDRNDYRKFQKEIENKYYNEKIAKKHIEKHFDALLRYNKNFTCYTLDNFLDPDFIKKIKECTPNKKL